MQIGEHYSGFTDALSHLLCYGMLSTGVRCIQRLSQAKSGSVHILFILNEVTVAMCWSEKICWRVTTCSIFRLLWVCQLDLRKCQKIPADSPLSSTYSIALAIDTMRYKNK